MKSQRSRIPFQRLLILKRKVSRCPWARNASGAALSTCMISLCSQFSMCFQTKGTQKLPKRESSQKRRAGTAGDFLQSTRRGTPGVPTQLPNCSFCKCGGRPRPPSIGSQNGLWIPETLMGSGSSGGLASRTQCVSAQERAGPVVIFVCAQAVDVAPSRFWDFTRREIS